MAKKEGFYVPDTKFGPPIPRKFNNPLDLRSWKDSAGNPYTEVNGFVDFPACQIAGCQHPDHPCETGFHAGKVQIWTNAVKRGMTFLEFFAGRPGFYAGFAPEKDKNDPVGYATEVLAQMTRELGLDPSLTINSKIATIASDASKPPLALKPSIGPLVLPAPVPVKVPLHAA